MSLSVPRLRRRRPPAPQPTRVQRALDRSTLLAELEVAVPAPERIVHWDAMTRTCPDCAENVSRAAGNCRHCGFVLA
jgi:hypothetical protein